MRLIDTCTVCHAVLHPESSDLHYEWHLKLDRALEAIREVLLDIRGDK